MANASSVSVQGRLTVYPSEGAPVPTTVEVAPLSRVGLRVSDVATAPSAAVLAEFDGGEVAVQHELVGPSGRSVSACASSPAATWYFPNATTRPGAKLTCSPSSTHSPTDAVVDISFEAEDGARTPQPFQGLVVPGSGVTTVDVSEVVTLRQELATTVTVRPAAWWPSSSQVITEAEGLPPSVDRDARRARTRAVWLFPDGIGADAYQERYVLFNPGDVAAEVDLVVLLDDPETNGVAEPFEITVQPHRYAIVDVFGDGRVPIGVAHAAAVRTRNEVPVVAQRVIVGPRGLGATWSRVHDRIASGGRPMARPDGFVAGDVG